jgi:hypothetical protein
MRTHPELPGWARVLLAVLITVALSALVYWLSSVVASAAQPPPPATCRLEGCFCEASSGRFPEQAANAVSSFAFIFLGIWALLSTREPEVGTRERGLKPYFAVTMIFLGVSSFYYHATLSFIGQFFDIFSMYAFGLLLLLGALYRSGRVAGWLAVVLFGVLSIALAVTQYLLPEARRVLFALVLVPGIVLELTPVVTGYSPRSPRVRYLYVGLVALVVAYAIWLLDQNHIVCNPESIVQGHGAWHVLTALAAYMIFVHYRQTPHPSR